jgi:predicted nucleic acid-binding protein
VALSGWVLDKSAAVRAPEPDIGRELGELAGSLYICPIGELEQLFSARSARHYDELQTELHARFDIAAAPPDVLDRVLTLQRDLAHHHGMWHRLPIPDLLIAETALHHNMGVVHVDGDYDRIAEVRPLTSRRLASATR